VQDNESKSSKGVLRGLHFQKPPYAQAKLVRCIEGKVLDVAVDIREGSEPMGNMLPLNSQERTKNKYSFLEDLLMVF
jgi:dTDP-4-dehydrorhamnose 3,5-epimerase